jgi:hypothetical protein
MRVFANGQDKPGEVSTNGQPDHHWRHFIFLMIMQIPSMVENNVHKDKT